MATPEKVRFGFFGAGSIALFRHGLELSQNPAAEIVLVYDPIKSRAEYLVKHFGGKVAASEEEILKSKEIDAVIVAAYNNEHARLTIAAFEAGKHVLCEKPMAISLEEGSAMVAAGKKAGKKLMIGHNQCLMAPHLKAKQLLQEGIIGDVLTFRTSFCHGGPERWSQDKGPHTWFFKKEKAYVGSMGDLGIHKTYLLPWLLGTDIAEVGAFMDVLHKKDDKGKPITVDDNAMCILRMANGVIGQLTSSWTFYGGEDNSTIITGTKGYMVLGANPDYQVEVFLDNGEVIRYKVGAMATNTVQVKSGIPDLFVDCILDDFEPPFDGIKGYKALAAVVACMESSEAGKIVKVQNELVPVKAAGVAKKSSPVKKSSPAKSSTAKKAKKA